MFALPYFPVHLRGFTLFFVSFLKFSCDSDRIECFTHFDPDHETFKYKILVKFVGQMDSASKVWLLMYWLLEVFCYFRLLWFTIPCCAFHSNSTFLSWLRKIFLRPVAEEIYDSKRLGFVQHTKKIFFKVKVHSI